VKGPNPSRCEADDDPVPPADWGQEAFPLYRDGVIIDTVEPTWEDLRRVVMRYGTRNSLLGAIMPTASTAQILRNTESVEGPQSNLYSRKVLNCSYPVIDRFMLANLQDIGLWNKYTLEFIQACNGSVIKLHEYVANHPEHYSEFNGDWARLAHIQLMYRTQWEVSQKVMLKQAADRGRYLCQSASTNVFMADPTEEKLTALHLYTDDLGLKTGMYYLRQDPEAETIKFTVDPVLSQYVKKSYVQVQTDKAAVKAPQLSWDIVGAVGQQTLPLRNETAVKCTDKVCFGCQ
jgi:ribonucleoside-diphosphate reductase alpha chain